MKNATPQNIAMKIVRGCDRLADVDSNREPVDPLRALYLNEWQTLLMRLSALAKYLGISRRCKHCGNDL
jgi:hypothetical protein